MKTKLLYALLIPVLFALGCNDDDDDLTPNQSTTVFINQDITSTTT